MYPCGYLSTGIPAHSDQRVLQGTSVSAAVLVCPVKYLGRLSTTLAPWQSPLCPVKHLSRLLTTLTPCQLPLRPVNHLGHLSTTLAPCQSPLSPVNHLGPSRPLQDCSNHHGPLSISTPCSIRCSRRNGMPPVCLCPLHTLWVTQASGRSLRITPPCLCLLHVLFSHTCTCHAHVSTVISVHLTVPDARSPEPPLYMDVVAVT